MGMERRAERKDEEDTMTAAKAMKPNGGADDCLVREQSALNRTSCGRCSRGRTCNAHGNK